MVESDVRRLCGLRLEKAVEGPELGARKQEPTEEDLANEKDILKVALPLAEILVDTKLNFVEEPVEIFGRELEAETIVEITIASFSRIQNVALNSRGNVRSDDIEVSCIV
ncbi:hypothetical protein Tco_0737933 [Tanacetum coccineum]